MSDSKLIETNFGELLREQEEDVFFEKYESMPCMFPDFTFTAKPERWRLSDWIRDIRYSLSERLELIAKWIEP